MLSFSRWVSVDLLVVASSSLAAGGERESNHQEQHCVLRHLTSNQTGVFEDNRRAAGSECLPILFAEQLGGEALPLGNPFDLEGDSVDRVLEARQSLVGGGVAPTLARLSCLRVASFARTIALIE